MRQQPSKDITTWSMKKLFTELRCGAVDRVQAAEFEIERRIKAARKDGIKEALSALAADSGEAAPTSVVRRLLFQK